MPAGRETSPAQEESFLAEMEEEYYQNGAGLKNTFDLTPIYEKYAHLFTAGRVKDLLASRQTKEDRYLAQFAAFQYLGRAVSALTDEIATAETQATLEWEGAEIPYRAGLLLATKEPDRRRRAELSGRARSVMAQMNEVRAARIAQLHAQVERLGFDSYRAFCDELLGLGLDRLSRQMDVLLAESESLWDRELTGHLAGVEVPREEAHLADLRHLLTAPQFDPLFPGERALPAVKRTVANLGIDLDSLENLHLDAEERELKSPRPFCSPVRVPSDVRLVTMPRGGREDYNMLLHETGHALHFTHADPAAPFAFRCLGDNSVTEGYAFLLNLLLRSPAWLGEVAGLAASGAYLRFARFYQLYYLRRLGARLGYEQELHGRGAPAGDLAALYVERLEQALKVQIPPEEHLFDIDDGFYSACYLRAWMLEVQLRQKLIQEFGERWFARPEAGGFLKGLWAHGLEFTADELAQRLGYPGLQVEPLIADLVSPVEA